MTIEPTYLVAAMVVGLGATLFMDLGALILKHVFRVPSSNYCLVGRWVCHMPQGTFVHASIGGAPQKSSECIVGWLVHYVTGVLYALILIALVSPGWLVQPSLLPPIVFGIGSVVVPFLLMHPAFGLGIAASRAPNPTQARLRSLMAHTLFGLGLYACAMGVSYLLRNHTVWSSPT